MIHASIQILKVCRIRGTEFRLEMEILILRVAENGNGKTGETSGNSQLFYVILNLAVLRKLTQSVVEQGIYFSKGLIQFSVFSCFRKGYSNGKNDSYEHEYHISSCYAR